MSVAASAPSHLDRSPASGWHRWVAVVAVVIVVAAVAFLASRRSAPGTTTLRGTAVVGSEVASVRIDGWTYGVAGSVAWVDVSGASHESGWPACLARSGSTVRITFGATAVTGPQGDSWRDISWVDCRSADVLS